MKPRTQFILAGALLIVLAAESAARHRWRSAGTGQGCGAGCSFRPPLAEMPVSAVTGGTITNGVAPRPAAAKNLPPSPKPSQSL